MDAQIELRCSFQGQYHAKYQRNNKRCGFKNLRCFPFCGPNGLHHEQGFCGAPINVDISLSNSSTSSICLDKLKAWGEFTERDATPRFPIGSVFTRLDVAPLLRTDAERSNPIFEHMDEDTCCSHSHFDQPKRTRDQDNLKTFSFHSNKMGYHYGWVGNKHSTHQEHAFCVYVAAEIAPETFQCLGVFYSSAFSIYCRRRHKTVSKEEKDQLAEPTGEYVVKHQLSDDGRICNSTGLPLTALFRKRSLDEMSRTSDSSSDASTTASKKSRQNRQRNGSDTTDDMSLFSPRGFLPNALATSLSKTSRVNNACLILAISSSPTSFDFSWLMRPAPVTSRSPILIARSLLLEKPSFVDKIKQISISRRFTDFASTIRERCDEVAEGGKLPSVIVVPSCMAFDSLEVRRAFDKLCDEASSPERQRQTQPELTLESCSVTPSSSYGRDLAGAGLDGPIPLFPMPSLDDDVQLLVEEFDIISDTASTADLSMDDLAVALFDF